jgi:hypothetical protein
MAGARNLSAAVLLVLLLVAGSFPGVRGQKAGFDEVLRREFSSSEDLQLHLQLTEFQDEILVWWLTDEPVDSEVRYRIKHSSSSGNPRSRAKARAVPVDAITGAADDSTVTDLEAWSIAANDTGGPYRYWYEGLPDRNVDPKTGINGYMSSEAPTSFR